jgi:hypothetical protein
LTVIFLVFSDHGFVVRNLALRSCAPIVEGKGGWITLVVVPPVDVVDDSFVPRNKKPEPISKPAARPAPKPAPKGKHMQLFKMRRQNGKGFYSTAPDAPGVQCGRPEHSEICLHIVFWCPVATVVVRVGYGQVFAICILLVLLVARKHGLV